MPDETDNTDKTDKTDKSPEAPGRGKIAPAGNDRTVTSQSVRDFLGDNCPEANILLDDYEFSEDDILSAMDYVVDYWNDQPPQVVSYTARRFPFRSKLVAGTAARLLRMKARMFDRNDLAMTGGGVSVSDQGKAAAYDAAGRELWAEYAQWVRMQKRTINAETGWGHA